MLDNEKLWKGALADIELSLSKANFSTWFKDAYVSKQENGVVFLSLPNQFVRDWVANKYHTFLLKALRSTSDNVRSLEFAVSKSGPPKKGIPSDGVVQQTPVGGSLPIQNLYVSKDDNLNPRYSFESFVVGSFNELAYAAAQAVIKGLGTVYNPLFIYGRTGHGKTHIIQAIGNAVKSAHPKKKIFYITSERFSQDFVNALGANKMNSFKEKFRKFDVFMMDDIQFLSNKEKTQEELFHLFDALYNSNRQIVFSCDQHPNYIPNLEDRLKSRFNAGMIVDIPAPDRESRAAILKSKAKECSFSVSEDVVDFLSSAIEGNVRELEGALNSIICQSQLKNKHLSVSEVKALLKSNMKPKRMVPIKDVVKLVSNFYNIEEENIYRKTRKKEIVKPRQLIMYILREDFGFPYPTIGQKLGGRDHTTVIHSYEKIKRLLVEDTALSQEVDQIRSML